MKNIQNAKKSLLANRAELIVALKKSLDHERFAHSLRVEKTALALGKKYGVSPSAISLAALLHDCARRYDRAGLLKMARRYRFHIDPIKKSEPKLFHGELGALIAKEEFGVKSPAVLRAISSHTTGAPSMSKLEKIIFLADHLEEKRHFPGIERLRKLAARDLDQAVEASSAATLKYLLEKKLPIHPDTLITRNSYLKRTS